MRRSKQETYYLPRLLLQLCIAAMDVIDEGGIDAAVHEPHYMRENKVAACRAWQNLACRSMAVLVLLYVPTYSNDKIPNRRLHRTSRCGIELLL